MGMAAVGGVEVVPPPVSTVWMFLFTRVHEKKKIGNGSEFATHLGIENNVLDPCGAAVPFW